MEQAKRKEHDGKKVGLPRDRRDRPVEQEGDKDLKEGGIEQTGREKRPEK